MNGNIFSEKYIKEKLNRLEQINSQKRLKVQQATISKNPQMSRSDYEKYKKILFEQNKKQNLGGEEKLNDVIPTQDVPSSSKEQQGGSEVIKMNRSLERNKSPKAGEIVFKGTKRNCSKTPNNNLNHSEILQKSPSQVLSPKQMQGNLNNQQQKLKQSKSLMKLSNTAKPCEMSESQLTQEIPNSSRTQNVLQNMKSILSIASPNAYFSNATSTMEDPNLLEQTQQSNNFNRFNQRQNFQNNQYQYTPQPISPSSHTMAPIMIQQQNDTENIYVQGNYPTYQTQQSIEFMNTKNPEFIQMVNNQNNLMKNSQFSNQNDDNYLNIYNNKQQTNEYSNYNPQPQFYQQNPPQFFQQKSNFQNNYQPQQSYNYDTFEQTSNTQNNFIQQQQQQQQINFTSPRTNNFQKHSDENQERNFVQNGHMLNGTYKRQYSQPDFDQNAFDQQQQQYQYTNSQYPAYERTHSLNSYHDNNTHSSMLIHQQNNHQNRNSQIDFDKYFMEEQQYLQQLSHLGIQEDLNESENFIHQLKHNQTLLRQEKEQLERELAELEIQTKHIKNVHARQQSNVYSDQTAQEQSRITFLEASFKKQNPVQEQNHFAYDNNVQQQLGFEQKWEIIEREEEETERSFMIISEYLNMQSDQTKRKLKSRQNSQFKEENTSKSNIISPSVVYGKRSDEFEKKPQRKNSDQIERQQQNGQNKGERDEEDMEWLDGIEESFCELKCINKNELMPYYTELQSKKKSYLDRYSPNSKSRLSADTASVPVTGGAEEDAYTKLKNQIIADSQPKMNQRALSSTSAKISNLVNEISGQEIHNKFQESSGTKGTKSPQFGASGKGNQLFSYLQEQNNRDITDLAFKDANFFKQKLASPNSQGSISNSQSQYNERFEQSNQQDLRRQTENYSKSSNEPEDRFLKSSSSNGLIKNFYNDINQIQKKNSEKFIKQDQAIFQSEKNIQISNEILDKINQRYPSSHLNFSKSGNSKRMSQEYQMEQQPIENNIEDEEFRQQQYIMRKLKEMEAENNSQTSSMRDKELQYSETISSYLAQGDSQFKRSQSPLFNNVSDQRLQQNRQQENQSLQKLLQNRRSEHEQQQKGDQVNEELQVADLHNYSSFRNELQQSEQQLKEYYEDQYFKFSNNKNSSFEKELQQIQIDQNDVNNNNQLQQQLQSIQNKKKNLFSSLMKNVQQELGEKKKDSLMQQNNTESTSKFQQKLDSRMEQFYQQYDEGLKQDDRSMKINQENISSKSNIQSQLNKVFKDRVQSDDDEDDSNSSGDELEETILQKLQKLKKKRDSEKKEKSPMLQNSNIQSEQKNRPLAASKRGSQDSSNGFEQVNKENNQNNLQGTKLNEQSGAKMKLDELFNKNKLKDSQNQLESNSLSSSKQNSTRDKISSIQQKLNNLFEKKNVQSPQEQERLETNSRKYEIEISSFPQKPNKQIQENNLEDNESRIDRKVIDNLAEEVEMLMKMQNLENQFKEKDSENKQLKQEYFQHERHVYGEDIESLQQEEMDQFNEYANQTDSQKNFFKAKQQLPLYEIEEEHSVDNSIVDQNFQMRNQYQ